MSQNIKDLMKALSIEDADGKIYEALTSETPNSDAVQMVLKKSQDYSKPFLESGFNEKMDEERKTWRGKYAQADARDANKEFGNKLTNKEVEDIFADPENKGKAYQAVIAAIKAKVETTGDKAELQDMLDKANGKIGEYETKFTDQEAKHKADFENYVKTGKLTTALKTKLVKILQGITSMNPEKAAELLMDPLTKKALVKLNDNDEIDLFDLLNPESKLKKSDTEFETLEGVVKSLADEYELPKAQSDGATIVTKQAQSPTGRDPIYQNSALEASEKLAAAMG